MSEIVLRGEITPQAVFVGNIMQVGPQGDKGDKGDTGSTGVAGADGMSAYASAVAGGYTDTQANFYTDLAAVQGLAAELEALL